MGGSSFSVGSSELSFKDSQSLAVSGNSSLVLSSPDVSHMSDGSSVLGVSSSLRSQPG